MKFEIYELNGKFCVRAIDFDGKNLFKHKTLPIWFFQPKKETLFNTKIEANQLLEHEIRHYRYSLR